jgi:hypothetical protein
VQNAGRHRHPFYTLDGEAKTDLLSKRIQYRHLLRDYRVLKLLEYEYKRKRVTHGYVAISGVVLIVKHREDDRDCKGTRHHKGGIAKKRYKSRDKEPHRFW